MSASIHYTRTAKVLHWSMAILLPAMMALGFYMQALPFSPEKLQLYSWHKWAGVSLFLLVLLRLSWRMLHRPPPLPASMPSWQMRAAHISHVALYVLMLTIPLSGWLMSSAKGVQTVWFGIIPLPDLLPANEVLGDVLGNVHLGLNLGLIVLVLLHVAAALKHHFIDRDPGLVRMLPRRH